MYPFSVCVFVFSVCAVQVDAIKADDGQTDYELGGAEKEVEEVGLAE